MCRLYASTWACPPAVGTVEECRQKIYAYKKAFLFSCAYPLTNSFDYKGMMKAHGEFTQLCDKLYEEIKNIFSDFMILSNEGFTRCVECTYLNESCRFPDKLFPSVEGFGIIVSKTVLQAGIAYNNGQNTVTYFGMILF